MPEFVELAYRNRRTVRERLERQGVKCASDWCTDSQHLCMPLRQQRSAPPPTSAPRLWPCLALRSGAAHARAPLRLRWAQNWDDGQKGPSSPMGDVLARAAPGWKDLWPQLYPSLPGFTYDPKRNGNLGKARSEKRPGTARLLACTQFCSGTEHVRRAGRAAQAFWPVPDERMWADAEPACVPSRRPRFALASTVSLAGCRAMEQRRQRPPFTHATPFTPEPASAWLSHRMLEFTRGHVAAQCLTVCVRSLQRLGTVRPMISAGLLRRLGACLQMRLVGTAPVMFEGKELEYLRRHDFGKEGIKSFPRVAFPSDHFGLVAQLALRDKT